MKNKLWWVVLTTRGESLHVTNGDLMFDYRGLYVYQVVAHNAASARREGRRRWEAGEGSDRPGGLGPREPEPRRKHVQKEFNWIEEDSRNSGYGRGKAD